MTLEEIKARLKELLIAGLALENTAPEDIKDEAPLFGGGLGLDSLDAVEIAVILQRNFGVQVRDAEEGRRAFQSIETLARCVHEGTAAKGCGDGRTQP